MPPKKFKTSPRIVIEAGRKKKDIFRELWRFRELFFFLSWKDILVRYKQTVLGVSWSVFQPLITMVIFTLVFGKLAKMPSEDVPYPILVYAGILPWQFFANSLTECSSSLINNMHLVSKIYFPRIIIPVSKIIVTLIDFVISFILLVLLMVVFNRLPGWGTAVIPLLLLATMLLSLGLGLWFSALNVRYRDFRYVVPFIVQLGLYISPVGFSSTVVPGKWRLLYSLNPMAGIIDGFRWALLRGQTRLFVPGFIISLLLVLVIFLSGFLYFRKVERSFADLI